jgi:hypothetical protein
VSKSAVKSTKTRIYGGLRKMWRESVGTAPALPSNLNAGTIYQSVSCFRAGATSMVDAIAAYPTDFVSKP